MRSKNEQAFGCDAIGIFKTKRHAKIGLVEQSGHVIFQIRTTNGILLILRRGRALEVFRTFLTSSGGRNNGLLRARSFRKCF
jgi:hypothetical protein